MILQQNSNINNVNSGNNNNLNINMNQRFRKRLTIDKNSTGKLTWSIDDFWKFESYSLKIERKRETVIEINIMHNKFRKLGSKIKININFN